MENENSILGRNEALNIGVVMPRFAICPLCAREVKLTKAGRFRKHGHKYSLANKDYFGFVKSNGLRVETTPPCIKSGDKYVCPKNGA